MGETIKAKIKTIYSSLSDKEKIIADYVLKNPKKICTGSINTLSEKIGVANSTFFQFTKKLGYNGFKEFKFDIIIQENSNTNLLIHHEIKKSDDIMTMATKVFDSSLTSIEETKKILYKDDLIGAVNIIKNSNNLYLFGIGASNIIAYDAYHKFLRSPFNVSYNCDYHMQMMNTTRISSKDCAILISHSGQTIETINIAKSIKENGGKIIVITSQRKSLLSEYGDIILCTISEETDFRSEAMASRISQLCIIDALYTILMFNHKAKYHKTVSKVRQALKSSKINKYYTGSVSE